MSAEDTPVRVLVVEKHELARDAMIARLEDHPDTRVVGVVSGALSGKELLDLANERRADVVILDFSVSPPGADAFEVIDAISDAKSGMRLVALVRRTDGILIRRLTASRVGGCLYNDDSRVLALGAVVRDVHRGRVTYSTEIYERIFIHLDASLTERELDVLHLLGEGLSNQGIAHRLCISPHTVQNHISNIYGKLAIPQDPEVSPRVWAINVGRDSGLVRAGAPAVIG